MKYTDITGTTDIDSSIAFLKKGKAASNIERYKKQFEPAGHATLDKSLRPDKQIMKENGELDRMELVNRLALPFQKKIVSATVAFTFGNPVKLVCHDETEPAKDVLTAVQRILKDNKVDSHNRRVARELARSTETAECWFPVSVDSHEKYGFPTPFKLRVQQFSPWAGDLLYPVFDPTGDMVAFGREFTVSEIVEGTAKEVKYFEVYTDEHRVVWTSGIGGWVQKTEEPNVLGKIPVIYGKQESVDWQDVQESIDRLEKLLSNFADTNDYHGSPKIFIEGSLIGFAKKGESGAILEGEKGSKAEYLSWDHAPESVKLEIETLIRFIYSFTQTPDISFDSVKGLQDISGIALRMLFLDAHLKVQEKREVLDEYLQRRLNVIKGFVGKFNKSLEKAADMVEIEPEIQPFMVDDMKNALENILSANGNKPVISRKTAIKLSGLVDDVDAEYDAIEEETASERTFDIAGVTV